MPATPAVQTAGAAAGPGPWHTTWEPLTHRSQPGAAQTLSLGEAGEERQNRRAAQHRFTFPVQRAGLEGAGDKVYRPEPRSNQRGKGALRSRTIAPWRFLQPERRELGISHTKRPALIPAPNTRPSPEQCNGTPLPPRGHWAPAALTGAPGAPSSLPGPPLLPALSFQAPGQAAVVQRVGTLLTQLLTPMRRNQRQQSNVSGKNTIKKVSPCKGHDT